jgi:hypothetical protein
VEVQTLMAAYRDYGWISPCGQCPWDSATQGCSEGNCQIAFGRGCLGFVLINAEPGTDSGAFGPEGKSWVQTGLPEGR